MVLTGMVNRDLGCIDIERAKENDSCIIPLMEARSYIREYAGRGDTVTWDIDSDCWLHPESGSTVPDYYVDVHPVNPIPADLRVVIIDYMVEMYVNHNFGDGQEEDYAREGLPEHKGYNYYGDADLLRELVQMLGSAADLAQFIKEDSDDEGQDSDSDVPEGPVGESVGDVTHPDSG